MLTFEYFSHVSPLCSPCNEEGPRLRGGGGVNTMSPLSKLAVDQVGTQ